MRLVRVMGIDIELHWTFLILLVLILLTGGLSSVAIAVILFTSVVLHELSHSYVARMFRVAVRRIILLPIGGMSVIEELSMPPATEFWVALAGPASSFALALLSALVEMSVGDPSTQLVAGVAKEANLILGAFNLLPAIPLDGGRVWRAWRQRGHSFLAATREAVLLSRVVVGVLLLISMLFFLLLGAWGFLFWNTIIALFIYVGSGMEYDVALFRTAADGIFIRDVMRPEVVCASGEETLEEAFDLAKSAKVRNLLIVNEKFGVVNLASFEKVPRSEWGKRRIRQLSVHPIRAHPDDSALEVWKKMRAHDVELAPVMENGTLVGVVTETDIERLIYLNKLSLVA
mgnify:CR=1 FL=1